VDGKEGNRLSYLQEWARTVTIKMLRRKSKTQFEKRERNMQKAIALLHCLMRITPQQFVLKTQIFTKKIFFAQRNASATFCNKKTSK
jgi:hypothetical protein